jgi:GNAT superfamily N-acetyltransferase
VIHVRRIVEPEPAAVEGLASLLQDVVCAGASVGFLVPLATSAAVDYWRRVLGQLQDGLALWVAEDDGRIVGSVQLDRCGKENGRHRAEVQKLLVLCSHRGRGIASRLMQAVETHARRVGCTLLVLDTLSDSAAASVYRHLGWEYAGSIPCYAATPDGAPQATSFFFKLLDREAVDCAGVTP